MTVRVWTWAAYIAGVVLLLWACQPGEPTPVLSQQPQMLRWPVYVHNEGYGKESPDYPPMGNQCPREYHPVYNGHNWVCQYMDLPWWREFPRVDGFPDNWSPGPDDPRERS